MAIAGHTTRLKVSGAAVVQTNEPTTNNAGVYQVTNTAKRIWDPSVGVVVKDGGVTVSAALYSFDYLYGKVTFSGYSPVGSITVDGSYLPVATLAEVRSINISASQNLADRTTFDSVGYMQKLGTLKDFSGTMEMLSGPLDDIDPVTGGVQSLQAVMNNGTPKLLEVQFGGVIYVRAWVMIESLEQSATVEDLVVTSVSFQGATQRAGASIGFGT